MYVCISLTSYYTLGCQGETHLDINSVEVHPQLSHIKALASEWWLAHFSLPSNNCTCNKHLLSSQFTQEVQHAICVLLATIYTRQLLTHTKQGTKASSKKERKKEKPHQMSKNHPHKPNQTKRKTHTHTHTHTHTKEKQPMSSINPNYTTSSKCVVPINKIPNGCET
jgi:hypothetical protein